MVPYRRSLTIEEGSRIQQIVRWFLNEHINTRKNRIAQGKKKLAELANASDNVWDLLKEGVEPVWYPLKTSVSDAAARFKE